MPNLKPVRVPNFQGGLFTGDSTLADDNQLTAATNAFYNQDKILQTRYGYQNFGSAVADAVAVIHNMDATAANGTWTVADDGVNLTAETTYQMRGAGALDFDIDVSGSANNYATLVNSTFTGVNVALAKGYLGFWLKAPGALKTDLTDIKIRLGSDASNYYEFTVSLSDITDSVNWQFIKVEWPASATGAPVDAAIDYLRFQINYDGSYTDKMALQIDDVVAYSSTSTKPIMSLLSHEITAGAVQRPVDYNTLFCNCGTNLFEYDETTSEWNVIKTGLTEGTRFSSLKHFNSGTGVDNVYFTNGSDPYMQWDQQATANIGGLALGKYLIMANNVAYMMNDDPIVYYTAVNPADLTSFPNDVQLDRGNNEGKGTGLTYLESMVMATKERKIYKINIASTSITEMDYSDGILSNRSLARAENDIIGLSKRGVYSLAQKEQLVGSMRAVSMTDNVRSVIDGIDNPSISNGIYVSKLNNYYLWVDTNNDGTVDTCLVYSVLTGGWTKYTGLHSNHAALFVDTSSQERMLIADAFNGRIREMETGFADNGGVINSEVVTKNYDFGMPETFKTFEYVDVFGFISETGSINVKLFVDGEQSAEGDIDGNNYVDASSAVLLGNHPLGTEALGGGGEAEDGLSVYPFRSRITFHSTGSRIQAKFTTSFKGGVAMLTKMTVYPFPQPLDIYPTNLYI